MEHDDAASETPSADVGIGLRQAFLPALLLALGDGLAVWRAHGARSERAAAIVAGTCALLAAAAGALALGAAARMLVSRRASALLPRRAEALLPRRASALLPRRASALFLAAAPGALFCGAALGSTHTAQALLGAGASAVAAAAALLGLALAVRLAGAGPAARRTLGLVGLLLFAAHFAAPLRLWPAVRASALIAGAWLIAHAGAPRPRRPGRTLAVALACTLACALTAGLLGARTGNVRFITHRQAPAASLVYEAAFRLRPTELEIPDGDALAAARPSVPARAAALLGDANLLLITVDALRADRPLPALARALPQAVRFTHAYAQAPHTAFSITSLLTSRFPSQLSAADGPTLPEALAEAGFFTDALYPAGLFFDGRRHLERFAATRFGFQWTDTRTLDARDLTDAVLARLRAPRWRSQPRAFVWAHYFDPHEPYLARDGLPPDAPPRARYDSEVAYTDREIARLLDELHRGDHLRPTLVVLTADHGEEFGEHGGAYHGTSLYEEQVRVPLYAAVVAPDGQAALPPRTVDATVELTDVMPTLLELLGVARPAGLTGRSLAEALASGAPIEPGDVHAVEHTRHMLVRDGKKLIHDQRGDVEELYDLEADPTEQRNRVDDQPEDARALRAALDQWLGLPSSSQLAARLADPSRPPAERVEAARALGERLVAGAGAPLRAALADADPAVRAEAALALAELRDEAARAPLYALLDDPTRRNRAALGLGRLRDPRAVPALVVAARDIDVNRRRHALHYLGWLGGPSELLAIEERALADLKVRGEAYLAIGRIAQRTGAPARFLEQRFAVEEQDDARQTLAWALGLAGTRDPDTIERLRRAALVEPTPPNAAEALARVGLGTPGVQGRYFTCWRSRDEQRFVGASTCLQAAAFEQPIVGARGEAQPATLLIAGRALGAAPLREQVLLDGRPLDTVVLQPTFGVRRLTLALPPGRHRLTLAPRSGQAELDYVLLLTAPPS